MERFVGDKGGLVKSDVDDFNPCDDERLGEADGTREGEGGVRASLLYNGIHRFDVSRDKIPVFPLEFAPVEAAADVCDVELVDNFELKYALLLPPPVAAAATARFSSVSRDIFRKIFDKADVLGRRSLPILFSSDALEFPVDELLLLIKLQFNCRRDNGI